MAPDKPYTTQLQAGLGLVTETKTLLDLWSPGMSANQLVSECPYPRSRAQISGEPRLRDSIGVEGDFKRRNDRFVSSPHQTIKGEQHVCACQWGSTGPQRANERAHIPVVSYPSVLELQIVSTYLVVSWKAARVKSARTSNCEVAFAYYSGQRLLSPDTRHVDDDFVHNRGTVHQIAEYSRYPAYVT